MNTIHGNVATREVEIDGVPLLPHFSQSVRNHSPDGFAWGYGGSGSSQLALAILLHFTGDRQAQRFYQRFKLEFVATWPTDQDFTIEVDVLQWLGKCMVESNS